MVYGSNYNRVNYNYTTNKTHPNAQRNMVPRAVLMKTGLKTFNNVGTVNTAHPKSIVFSAKPIPLNTAKAQAINIARPQAVNTARPKVVKTARPNSAIVIAVRVNQTNAVKASACWGKPQQDDIGFVNSGYSRHMTGNIAYLSDFKEFDGESKTSRYVKRGRDTKIPQSSGPPVKVGDKAIHKELGDRMERAATTASSLEAEQESEEEMDHKEPGFELKWLKMGQNVIFTWFLHLGLLRILLDQLLAAIDELDGEMKV
ncbi:hypothetical protein Tco_0059906 [Tanacetum coccineum]